LLANLPTSRRRGETEKLWVHAQLVPTPVGVAT
jgi:hypothetical protein